MSDCHIQKTMSAVYKGARRSNKQIASLIKYGRVVKGISMSCGNAWCANPEHLVYTPLGRPRLGAQRPINREVPPGPHPPHFPHIPKVMTPRERALTRMGKDLPEVRQMLFDLWHPLCVKDKFGYRRESLIHAVTYEKWEALMHIHQSLQDFCDTPERQLERLQFIAAESELRASRRLAKDWLSRHPGATSVYQTVGAPDPSPYWFKSRKLFR